MPSLSISQHDIDEHDAHDTINSTAPVVSSPSPRHSQTRSPSTPYSSKMLIGTIIVIFFTLLMITVNLVYRQNASIAQLSGGYRGPTIPLNVGTVENPQLVGVRQPQMLIVCSHQGTRADMSALASHFQFRVHWINLEKWTKLWTDFRKHHKILFNSNAISALCYAYDIIAVTDNIWGGWLFLQLSQDEQCVKKLLFDVTNRYDNYLLVDKDRGIDFKREWHDLLSKTLRKNNWRYPVMVQNNPFESYYMKHNGLDLFPTAEHRAAIPPPPKDLVPVIRSLGASPAPFDPTATQDLYRHRCIYFINSWHQAAGENVQKLAHKQGLRAHCHILSPAYGGPTYFHRQNTTFWFMPYQVSVMKQSELVIAGIITIIPSMKFWIEIENIINDYHYVTYAINTLTNEEHMTPAQVTEVIDTWSSAYAPCTVEFNSWQELDYLIETQSWRSKLPECHEYRKYYQNAQLGLWHQLFNDRFPHIPRTPATPAVREAVKKLYQVDL